MQNYLVINTFVENSNENIRKFSKLAKLCRCSVIDCNFKVIEQSLSIVMLFSGTWDAIAKMEDMLDKLEKEDNIVIQRKRTEIGKLQENCIPYAIDIVGPDQENLTFNIINFLLDGDLFIKRVSSSVFESSQTGIKMFTLHMIAHIPLNSSISTIRNEFTEFCDQFNLDAIMEPLK